MDWTLKSGASTFVAMAGRPSIPASLALAPDGACAVAAGAACAAPLAESATAPPVPASAFTRSCAPAFLNSRGSPIHFPLQNHRLTGEQLLDLAILELQGFAEAAFHHRPVLTIQKFAAKYQTILFVHLLILARENNSQANRSQGSGNRSQSR